MTLDILMPMLSEVNFVAVIAATIITFFLGWIYYSPAVAGKQWMKVNKIKPPKGKKAKEMKKGMGKMMVGVLIGLFVTGTTLSVIINALGITNVIEGAALGFGLWLGLIAAMTSMNYMHGRGAGAFSIETTYIALTLIIMGAIITFL